MAHKIGVKKFGEKWEKWHIKVTEKDWVGEIGGKKLAGKKLVGKNWREKNWGRKWHIKVAGKNERGATGKMAVKLEKNPSFLITSIGLAWLENF